LRALPRSSQTRAIKLTCGIASMTSQSTFDRQPSHHAFVGRERELAELRSGLDEVSAGHGRLFLLSGEPGIGKTRLAEEISNDASARGMRVVWGRCWEGGGAPAYWPLIQILRACIADRDSEDLNALLGSGASEIARLIPELKLSLPSLEETKAATDSESARFLLFDAVATLLKNVAHSEPLFIVVDDLHDADQPSLQMLRFIARAAKDVPLVMICTYRDAEVKRSPQLGKLVGDLIREGRSLSLTGLSKAEVGYFVASRTGRAADERLVADLYRATDGNALYVEGVVRLLESEGRPEQAANDRDGFKIPDGVRESIRRQLAALSDETKALLSIASVIGNEFEMRLLEQVSGRSPKQMVERIDEAVRIGLLRSRAPALAHQQFSHALIRDVLYDDLAANRRIELHRDIGAAIEEIYKGDLRPHWAHLAHHFRAAGVAGKAIDYSINAGEAAYRIFAYEDASLSWQAALRLMEEHNIEPQNQARLFERLAALMYVTDISDPKGMQYLARALKIYEESGQTERVALVHSRMGIALAMRSAVQNPPDAMAHYRKAEATLGKGPDSRSKANLYAGMAMAALQLMLHEEGLAWSRSAMEISERIGNEEIWINAACLHGLHLFTVGRLAQALTLVDETSNRADRLIDVASVYGAAWNSASLRLTLLDPTDVPFWVLRELSKPRLAQVTTPRLILLGYLLAAHVTLGDLAQARSVWEESNFSSSGSAGDRLFATGEGDWLFATGEFEQAEILVTRELELGRRAGSRDEEWAHATYLARIRRVLGDLAGAERLGRIAVEAAKWDVPGELHTGSLLAEIFVETGCPERAHAHLARCREILGNGEDWRGLAGKVARAEAVVAAAEGKYEDAEKQFEKAVDIFRRYHVPFEEAEALHYWGRALNASSEQGRANEKLDAAIEIYRRCGAGDRWVQRVEADRPPSSERTEKGEHPADAQGQTIFSREGDYWTIAYEGKIWRLKDAKGLHYIAHLLAHPGEEIRALDLAARLAGAIEEGVDAASAEDAARTGVLNSDLGHAGEMLDAQAKADYQRRLSELEDELEEAREFKDEERIAKAEDEKEALGRELRSAIGLAGRDRRSASATERGRIAVTKAIRLSLNKIAENDASLGKLLSTTIKTGTVCAYVPDARFPVTWRL
jgi:tetratricopeptide (TPR) repeat protein